MKSGSGSSADINQLFVALARAAGFDARLALGNDRNSILYAANILEPFLFTKLLAAVSVDGTWSYFDPGEAYLPAGLVDWRYCGTSVLVADAKRGLILPLDPAKSDGSRSEKQGEFTLDENGVLEGDVVETGSGYFEWAEKNSFDSATEEERIKQVTDEIQRALKSAEVTNVHVENASDPLQPLRVSYHLRVPDYAERTGSRLFVQPGVFRKGIPAVFQEAKRDKMVLFNHRFSELDTITINLPEGFEIEAGNAPAPLELQHLGNYDVNISVLKSKNRLRYQRQFRLDVAVLPTAHYKTIKLVFDSVHTRDNHVLTLKRRESDKSAEQTAALP